MNTAFATVSEENLQTVHAGFGVPGWVKKVGEYAAPGLLASPITAPIGIAAMNRGAAAQGAVWAGGGALAGAAGGPEGALLGAAGGGLAGYYGALVSRDVPVK